MPNLTSPRQVMLLLEQYGLKPRKHLGQNFLIDANIARKIITAAVIKPGDAVVEVGPGAGALTAELARLGANVLALEVDRGLTRLLADVLMHNPAVRVINQDALKVNWTELVNRYFATGTTVKLISNLPYVISGPFMYSLLKQKFPFASTVLMLQKEVALRLVAEPGDTDYSAMTVLCRYYTAGKVLFDVSNNVFWPRPRVGSAVLKLIPGQRVLNAGEEEYFYHLIQGAFQQRRKTMLNNMIRVLPCSRSEIVAILDEAAIDPGVRPEQVTVKQFAKLTRITYNYHK